MNRSNEVLLSRNNARPALKRNGRRQPQFGGGSGSNGFGNEGEFTGGSGGGGGNSMFVVEVLVVEVPETATKTDAAKVSSTTR